MNTETPVSYWNRGLNRLPTQSAVLVSSSKYLNDRRIRDWVTTESLRRNSRDYPLLYNFPELVQALDEVMDLDRIEALFTKARAGSPALDRFFSEGHVPTLTKDRLKACPPGSVGAQLFKILDEKGYEMVLDPRIQANPDWKPKTQHDFWNLRAGMVHDLDHFIGGSGFDYLGEMVPAYLKMGGYFRYFEPELAGELCVLQLLVLWPWCLRTMLHYPQCWPAMWDGMERGYRAGQNSEPYFLANYEDVLHLTPAEAREKMGIRGLTEVDTTAMSEIWGEGAPYA